MCGICGALARRSGATVDPEAVRSMCETMVHRGPDSAGLVALGAATLAMRRLSIIDIAGGQQPLSNESGDVIVVCNGEIYNYRVLRAELSRVGHRFKTNSDCETIVHAYEEWGDKFLERLNGMFGLALWDNRKKRLVLARDRVGIKPLYYTLSDDCLLFASEPKAFLSNPGFSNRLSLTALNLYLTYEYVPTPYSIFEGVRKLRPGHYLVVESGLIDERKYWELDLSPSPRLSTESLEDVASELWQTVKAAVDLELVSDVPLGVFLSGGLDSSAVASAMVELQHGDVRTFSIGFDDPSFDESQHARTVAQYLGTQHNELILEPRHLWELIPSIADFLDEPLADASIVPTHLLSQFTHESVTVALGGDGGDELFAGYPTLQAHRLASIYRRIPDLIRSRLIEPVVRRVPVSLSNMSLDFRAKRFILGSDRSIGIQHQLWLGAFSPDEKSKLLRPDVLESLGSADTFEVVDDHLAECQAEDELSRVLYLDMKMYLEGDILVKVDRASMGCSLEARVPLLNAGVVEFATRLPIDLKLRRLTRKYIFRKAVAGHLPSEIINRPKKGFGMPVSKWLQTHLKGLLLDLLSSERLSKQGLFQTSVVEQLIKDHLNGQKDNRKYLWSLLVFQLWYAKYFERKEIGAEPAVR
jgi:asparagine synthase (glutamine-hydrolysing)